MHQQLQHFAQSKYQRFTALQSSSRLPFIIVGFGILFRVVQYLSNRSLWADESTLALNIVERSFSELSQPLDYQQAAPIGFLMVEKLAVQLLGNNEYALRLFPLLAGIVALFLFYALAKRCVQAKAVPLALVLFATLQPLVYYASEVKQYSSDVAIALGACLIVLQISSQRLSILQIIFFGSIGSVLVWFSHPVVFALAGPGTVALWFSFASKKIERTWRLLITYLLWALSFCAFYLIFLNNLSSRSDLVESFQGHGAFPPSPYLAVPWLLYASIKFFHNPLGFPIVFALFGIVAFVAGCISLAAKNRQALLFLLSPALATLFAAVLQKYPFHERLVLFLTPFAILLLAAGVAQIRSSARPRAPSLGILLALLLLAQPVASAGYLLVKPDYREEIKPVIQYVKQHQQQGDLLYIYQRGEYQFKYYANQYGYRDGDYIVGVDDLDAYDGNGVSEEESRRYKADLDKLRGHPRVWLILSHISHVPEETQLVKFHLDQIGRQLDAFYQPGSFVVLYDLS